MVSTNLYQLLLKESTAYKRKQTRNKKTTHQTVNNHKLGNKNKKTKPPQQKIKINKKKHEQQRVNIINKNKN